jgi:hypothetical protein
MVKFSLGNIGESKEACGETNIALIANDNSFD